MEGTGSYHRCARTEIHRFDTRISKGIHIKDRITSVVGHLGQVQILEVVGIAKRTFIKTDTRIRRSILYFFRESYTLDTGRSETFSFEQDRFECFRFRANDFHIKYRAYILEHAIRHDGYLIDVFDRKEFYFLDRTSQSAVGTADKGRALNHDELHRPEIDRLNTAVSEDTLTESFQIGEQRYGFEICVSLEGVFTNLFGPVRPLKGGKFGVPNNGFSGHVSRALRRSLEGLFVNGLQFAIYYIGEVDFFQVRMSRESLFSDVFQRSGKIDFFEDRFPVRTIFIRDRVTSEKSFRDTCDTLRNGQRLDRFESLIGGHGAGVIHRKELQISIEELVFPHTGDIFSISVVIFERSRHHVRELHVFFYRGGIDTGHIHRGR